MLFRPNIGPGSLDTNELLTEEGIYVNDGHDRAQGSSVVPGVQPQVTDGVFLVEENTHESRVDQKKKKKKMKKSDICLNALKFIFNLVMAFALICKSIS